MASCLQIFRLKLCWISHIFRTFYTYAALTSFKFEYTIFTDFVKRNNYETIGYEMPLSFRYFFLRMWKYFPRHLKSDTLYLYSSDRIKNEILHVANIVKKTVVLCFFISVSIVLGWIVRRLDFLKPEIRLNNTV